MIRATLVVALLLTGSAAACSAPRAPVAPSGPNVRLPPDTGSFDYQLGGAHPMPGLTVVARDATSDPLPGAYGICYVNGFQTQPDTGPDWLAHRPSALLRDATGTPVTDPDWPDEYVLDPSTPAQRTAILDAMTPVFDDCARKGFDAVEVDNLDTFTRFTRIDRAGAVDLAQSYVALAHDRGLAIGQKNAAEAAELGHRELGFDFAVTEECAAFDECASYTAEYGRHVLQIEYVDNLPSTFEDVCAGADRAPLTILRDRALRPAGTEGHVYEQCPR